MDETLPPTLLVEGLDFRQCVFFSVEGAEVLREDGPAVRLHDREGRVCDRSNSRRAQRPAHQRVDVRGRRTGAG